MQRLTGRTVANWTLVTLTAALLVCGGAPVGADETARLSTGQQDQVWREGLAQVARGEFSGAVESINKIPQDSELTGEVRAWLDEFATKQAARLELDRADFQKYVGYSKARIERKEYRKALDQALLAADVAEDREEFLKSPWLLELVNASLEKASEYREKQDWRKAWYVYADLGALYDREPRYEKLETEVLTHLRLDAMFGEKSLWRERIENVQWKDAEAALENVAFYYVQRPDFRAIAERGLEQLLLLAESKTAQEQFDGLGDQHDRADFESRIEQRIDQIRRAASIDRKECVRHFRRVVKRINKETVRLPEELVIYELMRGALEPLDDFTTIIWPQAADEFEKHTRGDFIGVGISIIKNRLEEIEVVTPLADAPAYRAGIQAGDIITEVDGQSLKDKSINKVVGIITGPEGTPVTLTIRRGEEDLEFPLLRKRVKIQSVKGWKREPDGNWNHWRDRENRIGYIQVTNFDRNTVEDIRNVMSELQPAGLKGLILDLRWNPGGLLDSAWQTTALFLRDGKGVVSTKGRNPSEDHDFPVSGDGPFPDVPLVVLVDQASASASEIVSGAIRDNNRGTVIGERTFGKFSVQNLIPLRSNAKLKITTARYYLPNGDSLHRERTSDKWGVEPDIPVRLVRWERQNVWKMRREADLLGPPKPEVIKDDKDEKSESDASKDGDSEKIADATDESDDPDGDADKSEDGEKVADAHGDDEEDNGLPPLEQPDENNRPKEDPQVDTALLVLRVNLLGKRFPTLAAAEAPAKDKSAKP